MNAYKNLCTEVYELDKPTAPHDAYNFYLNYARRAAALGPILEPMCGSGRFLIPLLRDGFDVDGVDASPQMLAACREKCAGLGLRPNLQQQMLHQMDLPRKYALAFIPAGSFGLITEPGQILQSLRRLHECLLPGGTLVLEVDRAKPGPSHDWPWGGRWWTRPDGAKIILSWLGRFDAGTRISHNIHRYELIVNGRLSDTEFEDFDLRSYDDAEFSALLAEAGFASIRTRAVYGDREPGDSDSEVAFECSRPAR